MPRFVTLMVVGMPDIGTPSNSSGNMIPTRPKGRIDFTGFTEPPPYFALAMQIIANESVAAVVTTPFVPPAAGTGLQAVVPLVSSEQTQNGLFVKAVPKVTVTGLV